MPPAEFIDQGVGSVVSEVMWELFTISRMSNYDSHLVLIFIRADSTLENESLAKNVPEV